MKIDQISIRKSEIILAILLPKDLFLEPPKNVMQSKSESGLKN